MKTILKISILLNLLLAGGLLFFIIGLRREKTLPSPASPAKLTVVAVTNSASPVAAQAVETPFRWQKLDSGNDYRLFIANLRAKGCPENTISDIVRGNVSRAFAWQRARLKIDDSGNGPWSRVSEMQLVNSLLGEPSPAQAIVSSQGMNSPEQKGVSQAASTEQNIGNMIQLSGSTEVAEISNQPQSGQAPAQPLLAQNESWGGQNAASSSQPQQSQNGVSGQNRNANTPASQPAGSTGPANSTPSPYDTSSPSSSPSTSSGSSSPSTSSGPPDPLGPNDPYALSAQDIMDQDQQNYDTWFGSQVSADSDGGNININPFAAPQ